MGRPIPLNGGVDGTDLAHRLTYNFASAEMVERWTSKLTTLVAASLICNGVVWWLLALQSPADTETVDRPLSLFEGFRVSAYRPEDSFS